MKAYRREICAASALLVLSGLHGARAADSRAADDKSNYAEGAHGESVMEALALPSSRNLESLGWIYSHGVLPFNFKDKPLKDPAFLDFLRAERLILDQESGYVFYDEESTRFSLEFEREQPFRVDLHTRLSLPFLDDMKAKGFSLDKTSGRFLHDRSRLTPVTNEDAWKYKITMSSGGTEPAWATVAVPDKTAREKKSEAIQDAQ